MTSNPWKNYFDQECSDYRNYCDETVRLNEYAKHRESLLGYCYTDDAYRCDTRNAELLETTSDIEDVRYLLKKTSLRDVARHIIHNPHPHIFDYTIKNLSKSKQLGLALHCALQPVEKSFINTWISTEYPQLRQNVYLWTNLDLSFREMFKLAKEHQHTQTLEPLTLEITYGG